LKYSLMVPAWAVAAPSITTAEVVAAKTIRLVIAIFMITAPVC